MSTHALMHHRSTTDPEGFWSDAAGAIDWARPPERALDGAPRDGRCRWFPGGMLNTCHNALDRHVQAGRGADVALIHDSAFTGTTERFTYAELTAAVATFAGVLHKLGVVAGDRVLIYFPMIPQAVVAMLACARLGAVHAVVFGGFGARELAARIDDAAPTVVLAASCGLEPGRIVEYKPLLDTALGLAGHRPAHTVIYQRPAARAVLAPGEHDWDDLVASAEPVPCVPVSSDSPLYVLYTSGTTGRPKGILRDNGGHAVAMAWSTTHVYGVGAGDVFFAASDIGWVVGHSYIVYGPLLVGAATVLYEGKPVGTPDAGALWRLVEQHRVRALLTAPTAARAIRRDDPHGTLIAARDLTGLRGLFLAGEKLDPDTHRWLTEHLDVPVVDHWWQTETGWPVAATLVGTDSDPPRDGASGRPTPGFDVHVLDEHGERITDGRPGSVCLALPLPPGTLLTVWNDDARFRSGYLTAHPGYFTTGDTGRLDADGYLYLLGRLDDVMNVAGHRLSSAQIEAAVAGHPGVAECAVVGAADPIKGQVPRALIVLGAGHEGRADEVAREVCRRVRAEVGPIAALAAVDVVAALPKTRSGKIVRRALRQITDGLAPEVPPTIENPAVLDHIRRTVHPLAARRGTEK